MKRRGISACKKNEPDIKSIDRTAFPAPTIPNGRRHAAAACHLFPPFPQLLIYSHLLIGYTYMYILQSNIWFLFLLKILHIFDSTFISVLQQINAIQNFVRSLIKLRIWCIPCLIIANWDISWCMQAAQFTKSRDVNHVINYCWVVLPLSKVPSTTQVYFGNKIIKEYIISIYRWCKMRLP